MKKSLSLNFPHPTRIGLLGCLLLVSMSAGATTYNATADFSSSNPSGPWAYGSGTTGTSFTPMTQFTTACGGQHLSSCWQPTVTTGGVPLIAINTSGSTFVSLGSIVIPTGVLVVHPGPSTDVIVQWTAPAAGTFNISGMFELLDSTPTGVIGEVFDNSTKVYSGTLTGPGAILPGTVGGSESFSLTETVTAGSVLSFGVNNDGNYTYDSTGFDATITPATAPEPTTTVLLTTGLIGVYALRRLRSRVSPFQFFDENTGHSLDA